MEIAASTAELASKSVDRGAGTSAVVKREGYISWDDYFMSVAFLSAMRSKDPSTQVGAVIGAFKL
jgi:deoxycytidylate deaminase